MGICTCWYPDGQIMHRGEYRADRRVGVHEWWYAYGTLAGWYEYTESGVGYRLWDRSGVLQAEASEDWATHTTRE